MARLVPAVIAVATCASTTVAQVAETPRTILLGPVVAGRFGGASALIPLYAGAPDCGEFTSGSHLAGAAGATLRLDRITGPLGIGLSATIDASSTGLSLAPPTPTRIFDERTGDIVTLDREYRRDIAELRAGLEVMARARIGVHAWVAGGGALMFGLGSTTEQTDNVAGPGRFRFADGQSVHAMDGSHLATQAVLTPSLALQAGYDVALGSLTLAPFVGARIDLGSRVVDAGVRTVRGELGCALLFDITPTPPIVEPLPIATSAVEVTAPERIPPLSASLAIYGIDATGARQVAPLITVRELIEREAIPLVPAVFFDANRDALAVRYVASSSESTSIDESQDGDPVVAMQRRVIDTLAARMRAHPSARLTMWGSTSSDEPAELAARRVAALRAHLVERGGIDAERIAIGEGMGPLERSSESGEDGRADNRRVELAASDPAILAPIVVTESSRAFDPPAIELVPTIDAPGGLAHWTISLSSDGAELARFDSDSLEAHPVWSIVAASVDEAPGDLLAQLDVVDSTGGTVSARTQTSIQLARIVEASDRSVKFRGDSVQMRQRFVAFEFDRVEPGERNTRELAALAASIRPGARVRIAGSTDRIGDERHNAGLATRRAAAVADELRRLLRAAGVTNVAIDVAGAARIEDGFDNDLPEGRFLSRGVRVVIEQAR